MNFFAAFDKTLTLAALLFVGIFIKKLKLVGDSAARDLSEILFYVFNTSLIINALNIDLDIETMHSTYIFAVVCSIICIIIFAGSIFLAVFFDKDLKNQNVYAASMTFPNFGFMGFPVVSAVMPDNGLFYAVIFNIPLFISTNALGDALMMRRDKNFSINLKAILTPPVFAVIFALVRFYLKIKLPFFIDDTIETLAACCTPVSMIMTGIILGERDLKLLFGNYKIYIVSFVKLLVWPLLILLTLIVLGIQDKTLISVATIIFAMPVAANVVMRAEKYESNPYAAAQALFISMLLSVITIPFIVYLLTFLLY